MFAVKACHNTKSNNHTAIAFITYIINFFLNLQHSQMQITNTTFTTLTFTHTTFTNNTRTRLQIIRVYKQCKYTVTNNTRLQQSRTHKSNCKLDIYPVMSKYSIMYRPSDLKLLFTWIMKNDK